MNNTNTTTSYQWAVVGAGPAGIAAVGKLLDAGITKEQIAWIDPAFNVGDLGAKWRDVSSNTKVDLFIKFLHACRSFNYIERTENFALHDIDPDKTCYLKVAVEPLQWVTEQLKQKTVAIKDTVLGLKMQARHWQISLQSGNIQAKNVVLAIGAEPRTLDMATPTAIPLEYALNPSLLAKSVDHHDTVAVFGASHSAIIIIRALLEAGVHKVINFYRDALRYAVYLDDWILFDNTGLKGETAIWARQHIDGDLPDNLLRVWSDDANMKTYLPHCTKAIHAVGFKSRHIPIEGLPVIQYNKKSGIIAPGLFGFGIAFPEETVDKFGNVETSVGLWKFMNYLERVMPVWLQYGV